MAENKKRPNPVDMHVGARVRLRRTMIGMSQEKLGEQLGITFQQVQKYEKGSNRIGASRLQRISEVLGTPVAYFFEGLSEGVPGDAMAAPEAEGQTPSEVLSSPESVQMSRAFARIHDPKIRRRILELVRSLAQSGDAEADPEDATSQDV